VLATRAFIEKVLSVEYTKPINDKIDEIFEESTPDKPVMYLLQAGADPTQTVDDFATKKKKPTINKVSMGEAQEIPAKEKILEGHKTGRWLLLSNCQLSIDLMAEMETLLRPTDHEVDPNFRLWITCEADNAFPLGLLQMAIKNSFVPPKGLQAGLSRTFNTQINSDFLERVEPVDKWVNAVFAVCFMHSIVLERRKFGPLGFTVPYEFNYGDMESSLLFIEKHMAHCFTNQIKESWKAINYITCEIQYGGRITDNMDREMFKTYGELWLKDEIFSKGYNFNPLSEWAYKIPETVEHNKILDYIN
jgi:dynein heavy chain